MVVCCSPVCKFWVMCVLVIKQEITERQRGLEKAGGAKSTFSISRILLSRISKLCVCLKWCINLMVGTSRSFGECWDGEQRCVLGSLVRSYPSKSGKGKCGSNTGASRWRFGLFFFQTALSQELEGAPFSGSLPVLLLHFPGLQMPVVPFLWTEKHSKGSSSKLAFYNCMGQPRVVSQLAWSPAFPCSPLAM